MENRKSIKILHWMAGIIGTLMVVFVLLFFIGYMIEGRDQHGTGLDTYTIITFAVLGIGLAGLLFAIWKPGIGGLISLVCFIGFNIIAALNPNPDSSYNMVLLIFTLPSILFLSSWWLKKTSSSNQEN